jgi:huntingtin interacting protein 1
VSSNEIAASTAQLVASSNVKANRDSQNRKLLMEAKGDVSTFTAQLVVVAKSCADKIDEQSSMDFTQLNLHQTKRMEMDAQVKILELGKQLEKENKQLYNIRKQRYILDPPDEV